MKSIFGIVIIFLLQVSLCASQTRKLGNIQYQYCYTPQKITIDKGVDAHIERFSADDLTKIIVSVDNSIEPNRLKNNIYLTSGAPYPRGVVIKSEEIGGTENNIRLLPLNINQFWKGNSLTLFVNIVYDRVTFRNNSFTFRRADKSNSRELKAMELICQKNVVKIPEKLVTPTERLNASFKTGGIYQNKDALDLLKAFNPEMAEKRTVKASEPVRMPPFPVLKLTQKKAAGKIYKENRKPDEATSEQFNRSATALSKGISSFRTKNLSNRDGSTQNLKDKLGEINYYCVSISPYAKKIGRKTMHFLNQQTNALNTIVQRSVSKSRISDDEIRDCNLLMDNIYLNVKKIADRYHIRPYNASSRTGYLDHPFDQTLIASTGMFVPYSGNYTAPSFPLPAPNDFDVCYRLSWWERIFRPRTQKMIYVYVFKCPDSSCPTEDCSSANGCFNGCMDKYTIVASCIGADDEYFNGKASIAHNTLTDARWTFNIYEGNDTSTPLQSEVIYTRTATCDTEKKQLQLWIKLEP